MACLVMPCGIQQGIFSERMICFSSWLSASRQVRESKADVLHSGHSELQYWLNPQKDCGARDIHGCIQ
jgi:hypothetical protein